MVIAIIVTIMVIAIIGSSSDNDGDGSSDEDDGDNDDNEDDNTMHSALPTLVPPNFCTVHCIGDDVELITTNAYQ